MVEQSAGDNNGTNLLMLVFLPLIFPRAACCILAAQAFLGHRISFACLLMHRFFPACFQVRSQCTLELSPTSLHFHLPCPVPTCLLDFPSACCKCWGGGGGAARGSHHLCHLLHHHHVS